MQKLQNQLEKSCTKRANPLGLSCITRDSSVCFNVNGYAFHQGHEHSSAQSGHLLGIFDWCGGSQALMGPRYMYNVNENATAFKKGTFYNVMYIKPNQKGTQLMDKPKISMMSHGDRQWVLVVHLPQ